jgi:integral membrane protein
VTDPRTKRKPSRVAIGSLSSALTAYRILALTTGTVLAAGTFGLLWEAFDTYERELDWLGPLWIAHGYFFMAYVLVALNLAVHRRWHPLRCVLVMAAGTVPFASFVAERLITHRLRAERD